MSDDNSTFVLTIDGPAGTGKSTVARHLAARLGAVRLDTGAMYRAVALRALRNGVPTNSDDALGEIVRDLEFEQRAENFFLNGEDVTAALREPEISAAASEVAQFKSVREVLFRWQREFASHHNTVTEGRDQGSVVFRDATRKFFLTATAEVRATRRANELAARGIFVDFNQVLTEQLDRDARDSQREIAPLMPASDALIVETSHLSIEQVVSLLQAASWASTNLASPSAFAEYWRGYAAKDANWLRLVASSLDDAHRCAFELVPGESINFLPPEHTHNS